MNKTEIQERIEKCESEIASLKAELTKCDCAEGIEQERCWYSLDGNGDACTAEPRNKCETVMWGKSFNEYRPAYMPECRQVTADDVRAVFQIEDGTISHDEFAKRAHKLGFRMKVTP